LAGCGEAHGKLSMHHNMRLLPTMWLCGAWWSLDIVGDEEDNLKR